MNQAKDLALRHKLEWENASSLTRVEQDDLLELLRLEFRGSLSRLPELQQEEFSSAYAAQFNLAEISAGSQSDAPAPQFSDDNRRPSDVLIEASSWDSRIGKVTLIGGNFGTGTAHLVTGAKINLPGINSGAIPLHRIESVEVATEQSVKRLLGTLGWGAIGAAALGPVGMLAGLLAGGNTKEITFIAVLEGGWTFIATSDVKTFAAIKAATVRRHG
jgi:hypothetical protein